LHDEEPPFEYIPKYIPMLMDMSREMTNYSKVEKWAHGLQRHAVVEKFKIYGWRSIHKTLQNTVPIISQSSFSRKLGYLLTSKCLRDRMRKANHTSHIWCRKPGACPLDGK